MVLLSVTSAPEATLLIGLLFHNSASGTACMHVQHLRTRFSVDSSSFFAYLLAVWVPPLLLVQCTGFASSPTAPWRGKHRPHRSQSD